MKHKQVIILLAHGSSKKHAVKTLIALKKKLTAYLHRDKKDKKLIHHAFLQFNRPLLEKCLEKNRKSKIVILPVFVSCGKHTLYDVPRIIKNIRKRYKGINIKVALPLGSDEYIVKLLSKRYKEVTA